MIRYPEEVMVTSTDQAIIYDHITIERCRQETLKDEGKFPWPLADAAPSPAEKLAVLAEEFGEVAKAVCEGGRENLREELVPVAACCVAWLESMR